MHSKLKSLPERTNLGQPTHISSSTPQSVSSPATAGLEPGHNTAGDKSNFLQIEVAGKLSAVDAIAKTKKLRWALRRRLDFDDAKTLMGSLANGSVFEAAVRPYGLKSIVRLWFITANRNLNSEDITKLEKWLKVTKIALEQRGWDALDEEPQNEL